MAVTKEKFLQLELKDISQVYSGKRECCRCGCGGDYISTSFSKETNIDTDDKLVERRLKRAKKLVLGGADYNIGERCIDVQTGENKTLTFYIN